MGSPTKTAVSISAATVVVAAIVAAIVTAIIRIHVFNTSIYEFILYYVKKINWVTDHKNANFHKKEFTINSPQLFDYFDKLRYYILYIGFYCAYQNECLKWSAKIAAAQEDKEDT